MNKQELRKWLKKAFEDDILKESDDGFEKGSLRIMPMMDKSSFVIIHNYYTGEEIRNSQPEGSGSSIYISAEQISKFVERFSKVIKSENTTAENIIAMRDEAERLDGISSLTAYFNLCLDRIRYANFVDARMIFHSLYMKYQETYNESDLHEISKKNKDFESFILKQQAKNTESKEFFGG